MSECQLAPACQYALDEVTECLQPDVEQATLLSASDWMGLLLVRFMAGRCRLPLAMGLAPERFQSLCHLWGVTAEPDEASLGRQQLLAELLCSRQQERDDLAAWLQRYVVPEASEMAQIIATASMGFNHLLEDLGLDSRAQLRELMTVCFPEVVLMNSMNLRWKKFFYRQLCSAEGSYVCRAPSCHVCYERAQCMAPEEVR